MMMLYVPISRLVKMLDDYTAEVNVTEGENVTLTSPNFQVVAVSVDNTESTFTYVPSVAADNSTTKVINLIMLSLTVWPVRNKPYGFCGRKSLCICLLRGAFFDWRTLVGYLFL